MVMGEPSVLLESVKFYLLCYAAYFIGIVIRNLSFPDAASPPLKKLLLLGVPICLTVITSAVASLEKTITTPAAYLYTIGIVMEHGMIVHETVISRVAEAVKRPSSSPPISLGRIQADLP
jgi:hypothetical protein